MTRCRVSPPADPGSTDSTRHATSAPASLPGARRFVRAVELGDYAAATSSSSCFRKFRIVSGSSLADASRFEPGKPSCAVYCLRKSNVTPYSVTSIRRHSSRVGLNYELVAFQVRRGSSEGRSIVPGPCGRHMREIAQERIRSQIHCVIVSRYPGAKSLGSPTLIR